MAIEFRELRWAIVASQHRSLRRAAEALNIRQSTLSRRLSELENALGAQLFERTNGGTSLTVAGREFLASIRNILGETEGAVRRLQARSRGENGRLSIGVYASFLTGNLFATLVEHHRQHPAVEIHTVDGSHDRLQCALSDNSVDIAIMTVSRSGWDDRMLPLWSERVIAAVHTDHPLANKDFIHWSELAGEPILIPQYGPGPELERMLISHLLNYGAQRLIRQESGLDRLLSLAAANYGVLLMFEGATGIRHESLVYKEVHNGDGPTRLHFAAYWRQVNGNPTLAPFLALLRQRYPDLSGGRDPE
ncbi:LysR family transcriptional regulator [Acetobacteraceae bacterium KSS8]|uniref:LysR family transcriptional regulator n=1 Tax=Endosaccharibacter trunci TaxID=2812733 RepID=A0ABT1WCG3_9PROT|nr:LysR family transcriptional regulator [Acetobacteraceae bacterium KSS8]